MNLPNCRFFHYDAFRGREVMRCRLLERAGKHEQWSLKLCGSCPVPGILAETTCDNLLLEGEVVRRFGLFPRVETFAVCANSMELLPDPKHCPDCAKKVVE
ncbi:MAG: hypothetical protein M3220_10895 [Chloroflexota bacterium]|nr:hypothetical protein [Chloroflexota bacterium]